jgi:hypothetical protein
MEPDKTNVTAALLGRLDGPDRKSTPCSKAIVPR